MFERPLKSENLLSDHVHRKKLQSHAYIGNAVFLMSEAGVPATAYAKLQGGDSLVIDEGDYNGTKYEW